MKRQSPHSTKPTGNRTVFQTSTSTKPISETPNSETQTSENSPKTKGRQKLDIQYIEDKSRRHTTFSKRKKGLLKKAYELQELTHSNVLLIIASETGHIYHYASDKFETGIMNSEIGKKLISSCLDIHVPDHSGDASSVVNRSEQGDLNQYRLIPTTHYHQVAIPQMKIEHVSPQQTPQVGMPPGSIAVNSGISEYNVEPVKATEMQNIQPISQQTTKQTTQHPIINLMPRVPSSINQTSKIPSTESNAKTSTLVSLATARVSITAQNPKINTTNTVAKRFQPTPPKLQKSILTPKRQNLEFEINLTGLFSITADALQVPTWSTKITWSPLKLYYVTETAHSKCGPELRKALNILGFSFKKIGAAVSTSSFDHKLVKTIIHSVPPDNFILDPITKKLDSRTSADFKTCYTTALDLADNLKLHSIVLPLLLQDSTVKSNCSIARKQMSIYAMWEAVAEWFQKNNMFIKDDRCYVPMNVSLRKVIFSFPPEMKSDAEVLMEMLNASNIFANCVMTNVEGNSVGSVPE